VTDRHQRSAEIAARHGRPGRHGPVRCRPGAEELRERAQNITPRTARERPGSDGKVIYDTREAADAAAAEFAADGYPVRPYPCARSKHGHWHLTTEGGHGG
jgi:hypothetical protein